MKNTKNFKRKTNLIIGILLFILSLLLIALYFTFNEKDEHYPVKEKAKVEKDNIVEKQETKLEELNRLYQENSDLYGWITIEGTVIDYPIMYTKGEDYYLYRDFYKQKYSPGSLFIDKYNTIEPRDSNLIIHGHNMDDGSMFHDLINYKNKAFYDEHKIIKYYTLTEEREYEIVSVFLSKVYNTDDNVFKYYKFYDAKNDSEYNDYISNIKKLSLYDTGITPQYDNNLITLSTCEYSQENGRLVVVAKEIGEIWKISMQKWYIFF